MDMKPKRVKCDECNHFSGHKFEDEYLFSKMLVKPSCDLGNRVMFRKPKFIRETSPVFLNDIGYIRFCHNFDKINKYENTTRNI